MISAVDSLMNELTEWQIGFDNIKNNAISAGAEGTSGILKDLRTDPLKGLWNLGTAMEKAQSMDSDDWSDSRWRHWSFPGSDGHSTEGTRSPSYPSSRRSWQISKKKLRQTTSSGVLGAGVLKPLRARIDTRENMKPKKFLGDLKKK